MYTIKADPTGRDHPPTFLSNLYTPEYTPATKKAYRKSVNLCFNGAPGEIRTPDRLVRS